MNSRQVFRNIKLYSDLNRAVYLVVSQKYRQNFINLYKFIEKER